MAELGHSQNLAISDWGSGSGYVLDGWGGIHPFGNAAPAKGGPAWPNWDIARKIVLLPNNTGGYLLDNAGGIHPFAVGSNALPPAAQNGTYYSLSEAAATDLVVTDWSKGAGYVLTTKGNLYGFGGAGGRGAVFPNAGSFISLATRSGSFWLMDRHATIVAEDSPNHVILSQQQQAIIQYTSAAQKQAADTYLNALALGTAGSGLPDCPQHYIDTSASSPASCIKALQQFLVSKGQDTCGVDGIWGPCTEKAFETIFNKNGGYVPNSGGGGTVTIPRVNNDPPTVVTDPNGPSIGAIENCIYDGQRVGGVYTCNQKDVIAHNSFIDWLLKINGISLPSI